MGAAELSWRELVVRVLISKSESRREGEAEAYWAEIASRTRAFVWFHCQQLDGTSSLDADDITQDVLTKLQRDQVLRAVAAARTVSGYMGRLTRNAVIDAHRKAAAAERSLESYSREEHQRPLPDEAREGVVNSDRVKRLRRVFATLSPEERQLLEWRYLEDRDINWIASELGVTYSAAAVRIFRVLKRLRAQLHN